MTLRDYLVLGVLALFVIASLGSIVRRRKRGKSCCGDCGSCNNYCCKGK